MGSTVRYLGVELEDALAIAEAIEIYACGPFDTDGPKLSFTGQSVATVQLQQTGRSCAAKHLLGGNVCQRTFRPFILGRIWDFLFKGSG